ncbi:MAG: hypothetical protein JKX99_05190 [Robiginitomaculum sp.]|nr:hypothetical protein [Robiginitomaculum sp.]
MTFDADDLKKHIPYYLTSSDQQTLVAELSAIASGKPVNYFLSKAYDFLNETMLQGDGCRGFELFVFNSGERRSVRGLVLSNSCDTNSENKRDVPMRVVFSPLVKLSSYKAMLLDSGIDSKKVDDKINSIKIQKTTNIFYLPAVGPTAEDYLVRFDDVHSMPVTARSANEDKGKLFTLSNTGFYMLVFKLSVHFCRLQEKITRKPATP